MGKYKIIEYNPVAYAHKCKNLETGLTEYVDFFVDGTLDKRIKNLEYLNGKTVEVERTFPHVSIACNVKVVAPTKDLPLDKEQE